jgi:phosphoglycolate phosphatase
MTMKAFDGVEAIILDKDGVFVDFHKLWLRIIAYRAQLIAENSSDTSDILIKIRTACIRAMGVDDELVDPYGPCSMPRSSVRLALATALFVTKNEFDSAYKWSEAFACVDNAIDEAWQMLSLVDLSEEVPGSIHKIQEIYKLGLKIAVFSSDSEDNVRASLEKFSLSKNITAISAGNYKTSELFVDLCSAIGVQPSNALMISDSPHDLAIAKSAGAATIGVLSGISAETDFAEADAIINSLTDLDLSKLSKKISK